MIKDLWDEVRPDIQNSIPFDLERNTLAVFRVGSHSHGTYIPPTDKFGVDDIDLMVVVAPPPQFKIGLKQWEHAEYKHGKWDIVLYDWQKFLLMIRKSNPNVVGTLWLNREDIWLPSEVGEMAEAIRRKEDFLSKQMYPAFVGYARGQLYKMTHHAHQGYMGEKRKNLVAEFGYDVKNAAHLIRLLRMACEAFETGRLQVRRTFDAQELIDIKKGKWTKEQVIEEAEKLFARAESALAASTMREYPHDMLIQSLMLSGYRYAWNWT